MDNRSKKGVNAKVGGIRLFQCELKKCADFLNAKGQGLANGGKWLLMLILCIPLLGLSVWVMIRGLKSKGSLQLLRTESIELGRPYTPIVERRDEPASEQMVLPALKNYWILRDSLQKKGDRRLDSFLRARPGLLDTIRILEAMVIPEKDTINQ